MKILRELSPYVGYREVLVCLGKELTPKQKKRVKLAIHQMKEKPSTSEVELSRLLFGQSRTASHAPFQAFIKKLSQVILEVYLKPNARHTSSPSRHEMMQRYERIYSLLYLTGNRSNEVRVKYWQQLAKSARQCHHTSLELECLQVLQAIYGYRAYDEALLLETEERVKKCLKANRASTRCKMAALDQRAANVEDRPYPNRVPITEIESTIKKYDLFNVQYYGSEALILNAIYNKNWLVALKHSEQVLRFFRRSFPKEEQPQIHFLYLRVLIYTAMRDFKNGAACWDKLYQCCKKNQETIQLVKVIEVGIILNLRCGETSMTTKFLDTIIELGGDAVIPKKEYCRWLTYYRSLSVLNYGQPENLEAITSQIKKLKRRVRRQQDFRTEDITNMLILDCIELLRKKSYQKAAIIIDRLRKELPKRLSVDMPEYRLNLFLKLLVEAGTANFHRVAVIRKTVSSLKRLKATSPSIRDEGLDFELIPFEKLWDILLTTLSDKAPRKPYLRG